MATATTAANSRAHAVAGSTTPGGPSDSPLSAAAEKTAGCSPLKGETATEEVRSLAGRVRDALSDPAARSEAIQALCDCLLSHHKRWEDSAKAKLETTARMDAVRERYLSCIEAWSTSAGRNHAEELDHKTNHFSFVADFTDLSSEHVVNIRVLAAAALALSENVPACQDVVLRLEQMGLTIAQKLEVEENLSRVVDLKLELDALLLDGRGSMESKNKIEQMRDDMLQRLQRIGQTEKSVSFQHQQIIEDWPFLLDLSRLFIHHAEAQTLMTTYEALPRPYPLESLQPLQSQLNALNAACEAIDRKVKKLISSYQYYLDIRGGERNPTGYQYSNYQRKAYDLYYKLNDLLNRLRVINLALLKPDLTTLHDNIRKEPKLDATQHAGFVNELAHLLPLIRESTKIRKPVAKKEHPETTQSEKEVLELFRAIAALLDNEKNRINGIAGISARFKGCTTCTDWVKNLHSTPTAAAAAAAASPTPGEGVHSS